MTIHQIKIYQEFDAPIDDVWNAFNDHANFGKIMGQKMTRIVDSTDAGNINGAGSVRSLKLPMVPFEETITKSEKPHLIEYTISKGTPLHHHYGKLNFTALSDNRSALEYSIELGSKIPAVGWLVKTALKKGIGDGLKNYARRLNK